MSCSSRTSATTSPTGCAWTTSRSPAARRPRSYTAGHRSAGAGQPGRLPARRARSARPSSPTAPTRCLGSCSNAAGTAVDQRPDRPARRGRQPPARTSQTIDFSDFRRRGTGYTLVADGETSRPFDIGVGHLRQAAHRRAEVLLHPAQRHRRSSTRCAPGYARAGRPPRRRAQPGRHSRLPAARRRRPEALRAAVDCTTRSTSPAAGTTPATTASTWSTAASRWRS